MTGKIARNSPCDSNITKGNSNNRLAPFTVVDKNQTITIDRVEEPQIAGGYIPEPEKPTPVQEEKK